MTDLVAELDRLHEEAVQGKCEMGLNLDYCAKHARRKKPGLGSCGPRKASLMKYAAEMQEAWPTISARVKALDKIRQARDRMAENALTSRDTTVLLYGFALDVQGILSDLDVTS